MTSITSSRMKATTVITSLALTVTTTSAWQLPQGLPKHVIDNALTNTQPSHQRRAFLAVAPSLLIPCIANASPSDLSFATTPTGLQYADIKLGSGPQPMKGSTVSIDYVISTTGSKFGNKIYSTSDAGAPHEWKLGDGSTIPGLEEAVSTMSPGGKRRVIIPPKLAYQASGGTSDCLEGKGLGPRPAESEAAFHPFMLQRFKNTFCKEDQPDLVLDIELRN
jgi:peptidylprolyl isomerase